MRPYRHIVLPALVFCLLAPAGVVGQGLAIETKVIVEAQAARGLKHSQPCFLVYPEGSKLEELRAVGAHHEIESALSKLGYHTVPNPDDATVFIKIDFAELEPFEVERKVQGRRSFDYSNSAASRNYAATMAGGRYAELANPDRNRDTGAVGTMIGPSGELIDIGTQKTREPEIVPGKEQLVRLVVSPVILQVSAWVFDKDDADLTPRGLWQVTATHESVDGEPLRPQLQDLARIASNHLGKSYKKPRLVGRK